MDVRQRSVPGSQKGVQAGRLNVSIQLLAIPATPDTVDPRTTAPIRRVRRTVKHIRN